MKIRRLATTAALAAATTAAALGAVTTAPVNAAEDVCSGYDHTMSASKVEHPPYIQTSDTRYSIEAWNTPVDDGTDYVLTGCTMSWDDGSFAPFTIAARYEQGEYGQNSPLANASNGATTSIGGIDYDVVDSMGSGVVDQYGGDMIVTADGVNTEKISFHVK